MSEEWTDWFEHSGGACPVSPRTLVAVEFRAVPTDLEAWNADPDCAPAGAWSWRHDGTPDDIIRYRVRRPRALLQLIEMVENLPAPAQPRVDA